jgi:4-amino-4-deoxy-L-arabinose transferase-like glycosyltransferase
MDPSTSEIATQDTATRASDTTILIVVVFLLSLLVRQLCFTGLIASDDLGYAGFSLGIASGTYQLEPHHYAIRYGLLLPVAAFYHLFGAHVWTSVIVPMLSNSAACVIAAIIARRYGGMPAAWMVGVLLATFPIDVRYASTLTPEPIAALPLAAGALLFLQARERSSITRGLAAGLCFGIGYLTKEPVAFVAIAFFVFALWRRCFSLAMQLAVGAGLVVVAEMGWYWSQTHDLLFRPHAMALHNSSEAAIEANSHLSWRIWKAYPRLMLLPNEHFGVHSVFALVLAGVTVVRRRLKGDVLLLALWATLPYLYLNFGSSSFTHYWALPLAPRYISLIYPPLFILAAMTLVEWWSRRRELRWGAIGATALVSAVGMAAAWSTRATGYGTETVKRLQGISSTAKALRQPVCVTPTDSGSWRRLLYLLDAEIGCGSPGAVRLRMDSSGKPIAAPAGATVPNDPSRNAPGPRS